MTKPIAVVTSYMGLIHALRARLVELNINYETLDQVAGWSDKYAAKLLAAKPARGLGPMSFDAVLGTLCLKLLVVPDPEQLKRMKLHRDFVPRRHRPHKAYLSKPIEVTAAERPQDEVAAIVQSP